MFKYGLLLFLLIVSAFAPGYSIAPLQVKSAKKQVPQNKTATTSKNKTTASKKVTPKKGAITLAKNPASTVAKKGSSVKTATAKNKISPKKSIRKRATYKKGSVKRKSRYRSKYMAVKKVDTVRQNTLQVISSNKEKARVNDSIHNALISHQRDGTNTTKVDEGYFATLFSDQKKSASFQTLDGTASVFKSISGWQDKKFYILTNEIPVGTIVKITTTDFKTICAKVINALPDVSNSIQYRLSDAAAAILGITNKTFQITVTY
jgi:cell wall-associated NlpC family hydrolase